MLVNPGSVGQTRIGPSGAHWAVLDIEKMTVTNKITQYDVEEVIEEAGRIDPDVPYLQQVLQRS